MRHVSQFLIAAPTSGSGKTTVSRGLMALLTQKGLAVQPFKCGPALLTFLDKRNKRK